MAMVNSIQVGLSQDYPGDQSRNILTRAWSTSFYKTPLQHPAEVSLTGIEGDSVTDRKVHGGPDKAILVYSTDHFPKWQEEIGLELTPGSFGENLSITGLTESDVCIGDRWQLGDVVVEISQPRQPCWKLARRHMLLDLPKKVIHSNRSGWYVRVIETGRISYPVEIKRIARPYPGWTIARVNNVYYQKPKIKDEVEALANLPELAISWREDFLQMLEQL